MSHVFSFCILITTLASFYLGFQDSSQTMELKLLKRIVYQSILQFLVAFGFQIMARYAPR